MHCVKKLFVKTNCACVGIAVFHLYTVVPGKVAGVTRFFSKEGRPLKNAVKLWLNTNNIP